MDDATLTDRMMASLPPMLRVQGEGTTYCQGIDLEGVSGFLTPSMPDRSIFNGVAYRDAPTLEEALPEVARIYDEAGVRAWTVWAFHTDTDAERVLRASGHELDTEPAGMGRTLADLPEREDDGLEVVRNPCAEEFGSVCEPAYGLSPGSWSKTYPDLLPGVHAYTARHEGEAAGCLTLFDHEGDTVVWFVGVKPEARGHGIAGRLLHAALLDARDRGVETTTLQSTKMGHPVYLRLGYRDLGPVRMWERRKPAPAA